MAPPVLVRLSLWLHGQQPAAVSPSHRETPLGAALPIPGGTALTIPIVVLAAVAAAVGLLTDVYRDPVAVIPAMRGQDLVTLAVSPLLLATRSAVRRRSTRATLVWLGLVAYVAYTAVGAVFAYRYNPLFLVYVALFSLSSFALALAARQIEAEAVKRRFDYGTPKRAVVGFLFFVALILAVSEVGQLVAAWLRGTVPELILRSEGGGNYVYALDLGVVMPLSLLSAVGLWRRAPWSYVTSGVLLIKATTMGLALISATWFSVRAGEPLEVGLTVAYAAIAVGGLALTVWFLRHCRA